MIEEEGLALRGSFIMNPKGIIYLLTKYMILVFGKKAEELLENYKQENCG